MNKFGKKKKRLTFSILLIFSQSPQMHFQQYFSKIYQKKRKRLISFLYKKKDKQQVVLNDTGGFFNAFCKSSFDSLLIFFFFGNSQSIKVLPLSSLFQQTCNILLYPFSTEGIKQTNQSFSPWLSLFHSPSSFRFFFFLIGSPYRAS